MLEILCLVSVLGLAVYGLNGLLLTWLYHRWRQTIAASFFPFKQLNRLFFRDVTGLAFVQAWPPQNVRQAGWPV